MKVQQRNPFTDMVKEFDMTALNSMSEEELVNMRNEAAKLLRLSSVPTIKDTMSLLISQIEVEIAGRDA